MAQNRGSLCVWYNIYASEQAMMIAIKGEVEDIERSEDRTEVIVDEGLTQAVYILDESLIDFGEALANEDLVHAMNILESIELSIESQAMWKYLGSIALDKGDIFIAQRCAVAVGDVASSKYLEDICDVKKHTDNGGLCGDDHYLVRCKLALIKKDLVKAEQEYMNLGKINECVKVHNSNP